MWAFDQFEQQVATWIAEWRRLPLASVKPETVINTGWGGLGIDGDDAYEILCYLRDKSGVDFSTFEYDRVFGSEGIDWPRIWQWMRGKRPWKLEGLTVRQLSRFMYDQLHQAR